MDPADDMAAGLAPDALSLMQLVTSKRSTKLLPLLRVNFERPLCASRATRPILSFSFVFEPLSSTLVLFYETRHRLPESTSQTGSAWEASEVVG